MQGELKRSLKPFPKEHDSFTGWELGVGGGGGGGCSLEKKQQGLLEDFSGLKLSIPGLFGVRTTFI